MVDGCIGERAIADKFREVYMKIYTKNESVEEVLKIKDRIERLITQNDATIINHIDGSSVKKAAMLMKKGKSDISGGFKSNALRNGPRILFNSIIDIFKSWITHGYVTISLLAVSLLPLIKGLKSTSSTDNYRHCWN